MPPGDGGILLLHKCGLAGPIPLAGNNSKDMIAWIEIPTCFLPDFFQNWGSYDIMWLVRVLWRRFCHLIPSFRC